MLQSGNRPASIAANRRADSGDARYAGTHGGDTGTHDPAHEARIAGQLTADGHWFTGSCGGPRQILDDPPERGIAIITATIRSRVVRAVGREQVLNQVVGTDAAEVGLLQNAVRLATGRGQLEQNPVQEPGYG